MRTLQPARGLALEMNSATEFQQMGWNMNEFNFKLAHTYNLMNLANSETKLCVSAPVAVSRMSGINSIRLSHKPKYVKLKSLYGEISNKTHRYIKSIAAGEALG